MSEDKQKNIFSKNLNYYISKCGKSQLEIAQKIGVSPQTFNTWCRGIAIPRMGKVQALADYFRINKSDLIEEKSVERHEDIDLDIRRIERARKNMDQKNRDKMMKILEASFEDYFGDDFVDEDND